MQPPAISNDTGNVGRPSAVVDTRVVWCGDNLEKLRDMPDACVDLIYIDPPFNSNRNYEVFWGETREKRSFEDRHGSTEAYIDFMRPRCVELRRVLKPTGTFYYHCDDHASHYVKVMLDQICGQNNFQSEVIWKRTGSRSDAKGWNQVHDTLLVYGGGGRLTWNPQYDEYKEEYLNDKYSHTESDGRRYMLDNMTSPNPRPNMMYDWKGYPHPEKGWRYSRETMLRLDLEGRIWYPDDKTKRPRLKRYLDEMKGVPMGSVWTDIAPLNSQAIERTGYPTQKPLPLLARIIEASSNPNDIVLDAFCGCGTALVAAQNLKRQWIGIDVSPTACRVMAKRLRDECGIEDSPALWRVGRGFAVQNLPWSETQLRRIPPFEFENWAVIALGGTTNKKQVGDGVIDGRIYPTSALPEKKRMAKAQLPFMDKWYPVQVKQKDKVGRPDIDAFEAMMMRADREKGFYVSFDYTSDAMREISAFFKKTGKVIVPLTVQEILDEDFARKLA